MKLTSFATSSMAVLTLCCGTQTLAQTIDLDTDEGKAGYSIGVNIGMNLSSQGIAEDLDVQSLIAGMTDALNGANLQMTEDEILAAIQEFTVLQQAKAQSEQASIAQQGRDFLTQNAGKAGVKTTASGLQYEVITASSDASALSPKATDTVNVHYHGTLIDGSVFDSSVDRGEPISFPLDGVIPGWTEGLQLMKVGDKFRFFVPSELAYGANGAGPIPPNSTLIFEVELLGIE
ncbi:MAG: FKBP-type peptidyl-prolyl cis-trans isomerase [Pseudomonadales bacterium]|nr:FKBP-type peptidyl-prolyl cis-trans isomerase [Pseudomonadales bacterium]